MAPNVIEATTSLSADIRVPPVILTDPEVLKHFPELLNDVITSTNNSPAKTSEEPEVFRKEKISSPEEIGSRYSQLVVETSESFLSDSGEKISPNSEPSYDIFDPDYVLAANTDWWQISPVDVGEAEFGVVDEVEFGVVDVPRFGDDVSNFGLWEDVDTFVSVVDISGSDVMEEDEYEPVYKLDTNVTTVWGLDIIWEVEEC